MNNRKQNKEKPFFLEYDAPKNREPKRCCYKDNPCDLHQKVLNNLVKMATGELEATSENLDK